MELAFKTEIQGKPTRFVEKIWEGLLTSQIEGLEIPNLLMQEYLGKFPELASYTPGSLSPKIHTIREDKKDRWKPGRKIHMVIGSRTPQRKQFAPDLICVETPRIEIKYHYRSKETIAVVTVDGDQIGTAIWESSRLIHASSRIELLALNDGFELVNDFFEYFSKDFTGKILHWTNRKLF